MKPITKYAKSNGINIAYQVVGQGDFDIVFIPGWVSNIDMMWVDIKLSRFLAHLAHFSRLILFDKRGTGLSDRVDSLCTLNERMDDVLSVLNAVGVKKAIFFGHSEGGTIASLFAATHPEKTISLITFGAFAKRKYAKDYPWAPKPKERKSFYDTIEKEWGNGAKMGLETIMPSIAKMNTESDISDILKNIKVPSLIIHRTNDIDVNVEEAKYLASRIQHSKFVELSGIDHCFWVGDTFSVLEEISEFITGTKHFSPIQTKNNTNAVYTKIDIEKTMLENFHYNLKLEEFARLCGRSLSVFKRDFDSLFNTTPFKWIKTKRLEYAKSLLIGSDLSVKQVCYECGFINNSHFVKSFKEKFKLPPYKFKKVNER